MNEETKEKNGSSWKTGFQCSLLKERSVHAGYCWKWVERCLGWIPFRGMILLYNISISLESLTVASIMTLRCCLGKGSNRTTYDKRSDRFLLLKWMIKISCDCPSDLHVCIRSHLPNRKGRCTDPRTWMSLPTPVAILFVNISHKCLVRSSKIH